VDVTEKILLIDDETDFLDVMQERLAIHGVDADTSESAEEALKKIETQIYDAVILDLKMPGMDGIEALKRIRDRHPELQVILLTGHASVEKCIEAMKSGAMDFILKPADLKILQKKIRDAKAQKMLIVKKMETDNVLAAIKRYGI
jgi:DNA-binding NtrC family response regulator